MDSRETRGEELRRFIKNKGMTQREAAARIGISAPHLANILKAKDSLGHKVVGKICDAFPEISATYLLTGQGSLIRGANYQHLDHVTNSGNIVNGGEIRQITGDAALAVENAQLREQLDQARAEKDRLLSIIETLTKK